MTQLPLEIADELEAALADVSRRRHKPKTEVVCELLEQALPHWPSPGSTQNWLSNWQDSMQ